MERDPKGTEGRVIAELLAPSAGDALEIGCGGGRLTGHLARTSGRLTAIDPELPSLAEAGSRAPGNAFFLSGSGEELPFADGKFDTVVFSLSLHHQDPVRALDEARRVLRRTGRILVLEPVEHSLMSMLFAVLHDESPRYEKAEIAISACGLKEVRSGSFRSLWAFDSFDEMTGYLFGHFELVPDPEKQDRMARILGGRRSPDPLYIGDITRYWLLAEGPERDQVPAS